MPDALSAVVTLLAPGKGNTLKPACRTAATSRAPGSLMAGVPADVGHALAKRQPGKHIACRGGLVVLVHRQQRLVQAQVPHQRGGVARVFAGHGIHQR